MYLRQQEIHADAHKQQRRKTHDLENRRSSPPLLQRTGRVLVVRLIEQSWLGVLFLFRV